MAGAKGGQKFLAGQKWGPKFLAGAGGVNNLLGGCFKYIATIGIIFEEIPRKFLMVTISAQCLCRRNSISNCVDLHGFCRGIVKFRKDAVGIREFVSVVSVGAPEDLQTDLLRIYAESVITSTQDLPKRPIPSVVFFRRLFFDL